MYIKTQYLNELTGEHGIVFATGTPISNSLVELYNIQRMLSPSLLTDLNIQHFDSWASTFANAKDAPEITVGSQSLEVRRRLSEFNNVPELMALSAQFADIKMIKDLDIPLPDHEIHVVAAPATPIQKAYTDWLVDRAARISTGKVDPHDDIILTVLTDGRKLSIDARLLDPSLPDDPNTKINMCVDNIVKHYESSQDILGTQLVFCDSSTPSQKGGKFVDSDRYTNVYDDIKKKLIARGIPADEIAYIHETDHSNSEKQQQMKLELFEKVQEGKIRVLIGSTMKMGEGTNVQKRLTAIHHVDVPPRPSDIEQRNRRGIRQGNQNEKVEIYNYVTQGTLDSFFYQMLEKKAGPISQFMSNEIPARSIKETSETEIQYMEIKAASEDRPELREYLVLKADIERMKILRDAHIAKQFKLQDDIELDLPKMIEKQTARLESAKIDLEHVASHTTPDPKTGFSPMTIGSTTYDNRKDASYALASVVETMKAWPPEKIGEYRGMDMLLSYDFHARETTIWFARPGTDIENDATRPYKASLGEKTDPSNVVGNMTKVMNVLDRDINARIMTAEHEIRTDTNRLEQARKQVGKVFDEEEQYQAAVKRVEELGPIVADSMKAPDVKSAEEIADSLNSKLSAILKEYDEREAGRAAPETQREEPKSVAKKKRRANDDIER